MEKSKPNSRPDLGLRIENAIQAFSRQPQTAKPQKTAVKSPRQVARILANAVNDPRIMNAIVE